MVPPSPIQLTLLSNDPQWIETADACGVDRIGIDIERLGKPLRQASISQARISQHQISDLRVIASRAKSAAPFARLNPLHPGSAREIDTALDYGAQALMLPYFRQVSDAHQFVDLVAGRAKVILLVETGAALMRLHEITALAGISEVMIGMNDLHLDLQLSNLFEVAASDLTTFFASRIRSAGLIFGLGGIAQPDAKGLPVSPDLLLARYAQLGVGSSWIARSFFQNHLAYGDFPQALTRLRERITHWFNQSPETLTEAHFKLRDSIRHAHTR